MDDGSQLVQEAASNERAKKDSQNLHHETSRIQKVAQMLQKTLHIVQDEPESK